MRLATERPRQGDQQAQAQVHRGATREAHQSGGHDGSAEQDGMIGPDGDDRQAPLECRLDLDSDRVVRVVDTRAEPAVAHHDQRDERTVERQLKGRGTVLALPCGGERRVFPQPSPPPCAAQKRVTLTERRGERCASARAGRAAPGVRLRRRSGALSPVGPARSEWVLRCEASLAMEIVLRTVARLSPNRRYQRVARPERTRAWGRVVAQSTGVSPPMTKSS